MSTNINAKQYTDYIFVEPSANIISPLTMSTYGLIILTKVMFSTVQIHQNSYFKLTMVCSNNIVPLQWIFITFPAAFDCFYGVMVQL